MSRGKTIAVVLVSMFLLLTVTGANVAIATDRTLADSEYVIATMDDEGVYPELTATFRTEIADEINGSVDNSSLPTGVRFEANDTERLVADSVTEPYIRNETVTNVEAVYAYLHGDRESVELAINLVPVKSAISTSLANAIEIETATVAGQGSGQIASEEVVALSESPQRYQQVQRDMPEEESQALREELAASARRETSEESENVTEALVALQLTVVDGLTGQLSHEEYVDQLDADERRLTEAVAASALAETPDKQDVSEEEDPTEALGPLATVVQWTALLSLVLPVAVVGLLSVLYGLTRSMRKTAVKAGRVFFLAGLIGVINVIASRSQGTSRLQPPADADTPDAFFEGVIAVFDGWLDAIMTQSLVLCVVGGVVFAVVFAEKRGYLDGITQRLG